MVYVFSGSVSVAGRIVPRYHVGALKNDGDLVTFTATEPAELLLLAAEPIREPIARYGPFVMNTRQEIQPIVRVGWAQSASRADHCSSRPSQFSSVFFTAVGICRIR